MSGGPVRANRNRSGDRLSRFVFTINNYTDDEYQWLTTIFPQHYNPSWLIVGKEVGENGTPHLQGACILGGQRAFSTVKMWPGFRRAHLETMRGKPEDSRRYCTKEDLQAYEHGTLPSPGKRNDLHIAVEAINDGTSLREMALGDHGVAVVKFYKGLTVLRSLRSNPRDPAKPPLIYWLYGQTGTGKTKCAWEFGIDYAPGADVYVSHGTLQWFDGYDGQSVVIFDDFRFKGLSFAFLLRVTDRYPMSVPFKGGFANWNPEVIIFTTPHSIRDTFEKRLVHRPEDVGQLERRVTREFRFPDDEQLFRHEFKRRPVVVDDPPAAEDNEEGLSQQALLDRVNNDSDLDDAE